MSLITSKLENAKSALEALKRKRSFKKANDARAEAAELQNALVTCRGKLEVCKKDFNRTIRTEARSIAEGVAMGADTTIQEQTMWDAAIGYLMVRDAIYSLKTISSFDSVSHAYEMLGAAVNLMSERQRALPKLPKIAGKRSRNVYGYITSNAALDQKQQLLDCFFEELKRTGNIEACLENAKNPAEISASRMNGLRDTSDTASWNDVLGEGSVRADLEDTDDMDLSSMMDIHPPV